MSPFDELVDLLSVAAARGDLEAVRSLLRALKQCIAPPATLYILTPLERQHIDTLRHTVLQGITSARSGIGDGNS